MMVSKKVEVLEAEPKDRLPDLIDLLTAKRDSKLIALLYGIAKGYFATVEKNEENI